MAAAYVLYSSSKDKFYIGSCQDFAIRFENHLSKKYRDSYASRTEDWEVYFVIDELTISQAKLIEKHLKAMKSKKYLQDLKVHPEISESLRKRYRENI